MRFELLPCRTDGGFSSPEGARKILAGDGYAWWAAFLEATSSRDVKRKTDSLTWKKNKRVLVLWVNLISFRDSCILLWSWL